MTFRRIVGIAAALIMLLALSPVSVFTALAETVPGTRTPVAYLDENGDEQTCETYTAVSAADDVWSGWMVVEEDVYIDGRVTVDGSVNLILVDGMTLEIRGGIRVSEGNSITIYAQEEGTGVLNAVLDDEDYEFFFVDLDIYSVAAIGSDSGPEADENAGDVTINGGVVNVRGFYGPGIGSADGNFSSGNLTVNGGVIHASAVEFLSPAIGAGWGGEENTGVITINGGEVYAEGLVGIGDGAMGGTEVNITGGYVEATGIGSRTDGRLGVPTTITGGTVVISSPLGDGFALGGTPTVGHRATLVITGGQFTSSVPIGGERCDMTLGWTESTDFIQAPGYSGIVTLVSDFEDDATGDLFEAGVVADNSTLANVKLVPHIIAPAGYHITVDNKANAVTSIDADAVYSGEVVFTVSATNDAACAVGILNADGSVTALACTTEEGVHSYTLTVEDEDVTVVIVLRGDIDLNGVVRGKDSTMLKRYLAGTATLSALEIFAGDADGNGRITGRETTLLARFVAGSASYDW